MDWANERYVRLYTRDTVPWAALGWEAQALFMFLLRKVDRTGVLDFGTKGPDPRRLALLLGMPEDLVSRALPILFDDGCISASGNCIIVTNFIEAQESCMSQVARQRESRLRRRDLIRSGLDPDQREAVIYFIQSEHGGPIKIGRAEDLARRLVGLQTSRPDKLVVLAAAPGTFSIERQLHDTFSPVREKGEWFSPVSELLKLVADVASHGSDALSRFVTCHSVPIRAVPICAVPNIAAPAAPPSGPAHGSSSPIAPELPGISPGAAAPAERVPAEKPCCVPSDDPAKWLQRAEWDFCRLHRERLGLPYVHAYARDRKALKQLPEAYRPRLSELVQRFFDAADDFVFTKSGVTVPAFVGKVSTLLGGVAKSNVAVGHYGHTGKETYRGGKVDDF